MPKVRDWEDEDELDEMFIQESVQKIDKKNHAKFRHGWSFDTRKRGKIKRTGKVEFEDEE